MTSRKLIPALYSLHQKKRLAPDTRIVGFARTAFSHDGWRERLAESTARFVGPSFDAATWAGLASRILYFPGSVDRVDDFHALDRFLTDGEGRPKATGQ